MALSKCCGHHFMIEACAYLSAERLREHEVFHLRGLLVHAFKTRAVWYSWHDSGTVHLDNISLEPASTVLLNEQPDGPDTRLSIGATLCASITEPCIKTGSRRA